MALMGSLIFSPSASVPMARSCREHVLIPTASWEGGAAAPVFLWERGAGECLVPVQLGRACPQCPGSASCSPQPGAGGSSTGDTRVVTSRCWQQLRVPVPPTMARGELPPPAPHEWGGLSH